MDLKAMMMEYDFHTGNTQYDDEEIRIYQAVSGLSVADRIILTLYAETQSLRKTAKILGVSYATTRKTINSIREELKKHLNDD
jgi:DNA-directed RNA polymerase specialized sigma24 family protein